MPPVSVSASVASSAALRASLPSGVLRLGARGEPVRVLQNALVRVGTLTQAKMDAANAEFELETQTALMSFQRTRSLVADGIYGPKAKAELDRVLAALDQPLGPGSPPAPAGALRGLFGNDRFDRQVALTFDDGPHPVNTPKVLDTLKAHGVKGTFFVQGQYAERHRALTQRIAAEGHILGNHSYDHPDLKDLSAAQVTENLARADAAVSSALGAPYLMNQLRPPYGSMDAEVKDVARATHRDVIMWNVDSNDWRHRNDDGAILNNVFAGSSSVHARGGVVLFHDIHPQTVRIIDEVVSRLERENFDIVTTADLLARKYGGVV